MDAQALAARHSRRLISFCQITHYPFVVDFFVFLYNRSMPVLKTSYELAQERIIASDYAKELQQQENKKRIEETKRLSELPDFVRQWEELQKNPERAFLSKQDLIDNVEINPSKLITKEEMEKARKGIVDDMNKIQVVETQSKKYDGKNPEVHWYGHFTSYSGFSRMNRAMVFGLSNKGVRVRIDIQGGAVDINEATRKELSFLENMDINPHAPKIYGATVPLSFCHEGKKILYTMMETSDTLHQDYVDKMNLFDEVWVPTNYGKKICQNSGIHRDVKIMPLGVDVNRYNQDCKPYDFQGSLNEFVFISVFKWGYRKGYDILLKAYMDEFSSEDNVSLALITRCDTDNTPDRISNDLKQLRAGIDKTDDNLPHIKLFTQHFPEKDMPKLYRAANAFVLISLGEGFCLPIVEAAACGLPVISSNCSAMTDYLTNENSFLVEPDGYIKAKINGPLSKLARHCRFYEDQMFPDFGSNAIKSTREQMRKVFEDYSEARKRARIFTKLVHENYSWDASVNKVLERIKEIQE